MSATVFVPGKWPRTVKNLGWLLKHWRDMPEFRVYDSCYGSITLEARMQRTGTRYRTTFASLVVLWDSLDRPVFRGAPLNWYGTYTTCGGDVPPGLAGHLERRDA